MKKLGKGGLFATKVLIGGVVGGLALGAMYGGSAVGKFLKGSVGRQAKRYDVTAHVSCIWQSI